MHRLVISSTVVLAIALTSSAGALAQHAATDGVVHHPSHVHVGLCPTPGDIVAPLSDVTALDGEVMGAGEGFPVEAAQTTTGLSLDELLASEHTIVVHQSHEEMATLIACGDVTGPMVTGRGLVIGLGPVADSGYAGIAMLSSDGDGGTTVDVFIAQVGVGTTTEPADPYRY